MDISTELDYAGWPARPIRYRFSEKVRANRKLLQAQAAARAGAATVASSVAS